MNFRNRDLTNVFDDQWKANHNDDIKQKKQAEKEFIDKMFNQNSTQSNNLNNMNRQLAELNHNIEQNNYLQRQNRINNIKGKL